MSVYETSSCGIIEIHHLSTEIEDLLWEADNEEGILNCVAFVNFSDAIERGNGEKVAKYLRKHKLGRVTSITQKKNPSSGRIIKQWTWTVDHKAFKSWLKKVERSRDEEDEF